MDKPKIAFETERLIVRSIEEADKEAYMDLRAATSKFASVYEEVPGYRDREWDHELNSEEEIYLAAFLKDGNSLAAISSFQNIGSDTIEFGFDVWEQYRNQGLATELIRGMIFNKKILKIKYYYC